jgi:diguanylate cyclase (GGDEF)-like protein
LSAFKLQRRSAGADTRLVLMDELTGLFNRSGWDLLLGREEARCVRYGAAAAVLAVELDGPGAGDALLLRAAKALSTAVRPSDIVARVGGDAFAVLLLECDRATAVTVRDRVERELDAAGAPASIGVASRGRGVPLQAAAQAAGAAMDVRRRERQASADA